MVNLKKGVFGIFKGYDSQIAITKKLQSLERDFETFMMKNDGSVADFLSRIMAV